ncbi:hypothetical protein SLEP1_g51251 [Rubroshorea leprosula]|uniref:Uncharacterized protein n=1 Tax=Rubroshorea leprosula TaxID=152421 RepID=A0AAV5M2N4_9ROSI|nr:hypothetical protein SLEP1_g51251 [Rubroshorea leprosula]
MKLITQFPCPFKYIISCSEFSLIRGRRGAHMWLTPIKGE